VVGGYLLLRRIAPEIAEGYARYYLAVAQVPQGTGSIESALFEAFPLPQLIRDSIVRQIEVVMGGI
jgi:hypothetical protein